VVFICLFAFFGNCNLLSPVSRLSFFGHGGIQKARFPYIWERKQNWIDGGRSY